VAKPAAAIDVATSLEGEISRSSGSLPPRRLVVPLRRSNPCNCRDRAVVFLFDGVYERGIKLSLPRPEGSERLILLQEKTDRDGDHETKTAKRG